MLIRQNFFDAKNQTYKGPLCQYDYNSVEIGNLLEFLRELPNSNRIYLIDSTDLKLDLPPDGFDTYIIGCFGELANIDFLTKINQKYSNRKLICLSSQNFSDCSQLNHFKIYYIEHLHKIIKYFPQQNFKKLKERQGYHSILSRRMEPHRYLFTAALLSRYPDSIYSLVRLFEGTKFTFEKLLEEIENRLVYIVNDKTLHNVLQSLMEQQPKILDGHQWSLDNIAYTEAKLHWVNESIFTSIPNHPTAYLTEKIVKPIVSTTPFVALGQTNIYKRLKDLKFDTGQDIFSIDFDDTETEANRIEKIFKLMDKLSLDFINDNIEKFQNTADYNFHHCYQDLNSHCENLNQKTICDVVSYAK